MKICIHELIKFIQTFKPFIFYLSFFYNRYYNFSHARYYVIKIVRYLMLRINCHRDLFLSEKLVINDPFIYGMTQYHRII